MLLKCYYIFIYMVGFLKLCYCQQINAPEDDSSIGKKYVVYFVQSPFTKRDADSWLCGGALVSPTQILTAAACLVEAENIYAIAGYKKYVDAKDIERDECTRAKKQRVVKILVPTEYKLAYENPAQWINVDVGVAIVEKPYNFSDLSYRMHCSYEPQPIFVNFENKYELASTHAVALGWGSVKTEEAEDTSSQLLQESSTIIVDKTVCANTVNTQEIVYIIEKYLLCASNNIDDANRDVKVENGSDKNCTVRRYDLMRATDTNGCFEDDFGFRRNGDINMKHVNQTGNNIDESRNNVTDARNDTNATYLYTSLNTRRSSSLGLCQNGHGCPLIRWVGDKEVVIGVASNANKNDECKGPFLYVSTAATSKIIKCLLETNSMTRKFCNQEISDKRYEVQEIDINWPDYTEKSQMPLPMPIIKRSIPDDRPLVHRPTKDIVKDLVQQGQPYDPSFSQPREQGYDQPPEQDSRAQAYQQPRNQMEGMKLVPRAGQVTDPFGSKPFGSPLEGPLPGQSYDLPAAQQYKPPSGQEYETPGQQYEPSLGSQYDPAMGQQYGAGLGQQFNPPAGQYESPSGQLGSSMGQQNEQPIGQQYEPQTGQEYETPPGQQFGMPQGQQYEPPPGQEYGLPQDQYEPQPGPQYEQPLGQQYEPPAGPQYGLPPGQQNEPPPGPQYESPPGQQYESPPGDPYEPGRPNEPPLGQQYDPLAGQQFEPAPGQYEPPLGQQYEPQLGQQFKSPIITSQSSDPPMRPFKSPLFKPSEPPLGQYETPSDQQYELPPQQYEAPSGQKYESSSSIYKGLPTQQYEFPPSPRYEQPMGQYEPQAAQTYQKPQRQPLVQRQVQQIPQGQYQQPYENPYSQQYQSGKRPQDQSFMQSNVQSFEQKPFKAYPSTMDKVDPRYQKPDPMLSQLRDGPHETPSQLEPQIREETFDQMYSRLHEPSFDLPHELNVPQYSGPPDEAFEDIDRGPEASNNQQAAGRAVTTEPPNVPHNDDVRVRPQMPVDYQNDYFFYSYRKNGSESTSI